jgi:hypothetical protein
MTPRTLYERTWQAMFRSLDDNDRREAIVWMWLHWPEDMEVCAIIAANRIPEKREKTT